MRKRRRVFLVEMTQVHSRVCVRGVRVHTARVAAADDGVHDTRAL